MNKNKQANLKLYFNKIPKSIVDIENLANFNEEIK